MATTLKVWIFVTMCGITINLVDLKPVPDLETSPGGCVHSEQNERFVIPPGASDGLKPSLTDRRRAAEPQTDQEPLNSVNVKDMSSASLIEPIIDYYRSHRGGDPQPAPQAKQDQGDHPKEEGPPLIPGDEQLACYEQQNIDPTAILGEHKRTLLKLEDQRPFAEAFQNVPRLSSRPLIYKEKDRRNRNEEDDTITSLYSDPEKRSKVKQEKTDNDEVEPVVHPQSVYKPVGVRPEFPVYDEDIDFHADPLQGILEDKYWLDPQEQEAVIRKYIDLANNNMQQPGVEHVKGEAEKLYEPKSVNSQEAFRDPQAECPCREVSACKDCSRGKWKKHNSSVEDDVDRYGQRKLLSFDGDDDEESTDVEYKKNNRPVNVRESGASIHAKDNSFETEKDSSQDYGVLDLHNGEESLGEREVPSFTSNYFGRKLLSFDEDEDNNGEYGENESDGSDYKSDDSQEHEIKHARSGFINAENALEKMYNRRSVGSNEDAEDENTPNEKHYNHPVILNTSNSGMFEFKLETENVGPESKYISIKPAEEVIQQKPLSDKTINMAKYYVPNKLENFLQKTFKHKSRYKSTIDPDLEFAIVQNRTFVNVSIAVDDINISISTEPSRFVKKRREQPMYFGAKGRRSYQIPLLKHQNIKKLQGTDDFGNGNAKSNPGSPSGQTNGTDLSNASTGSTENTTDATANTTVMTTTETTTTAKQKKKKEEYDEDTFDAEIANDIVETVIAESQSGSVVGHNLGLCRRNESLSKYAKVSPESEMLLKKVTECILDHIRDRLEGQSCTLLDDELLQFLKWMVLSGESYRDYLARRKPDILHFRSEMHDDVALPIPNRTTAAPPTTSTTTPKPKTKRTTTAGTTIPQY